MLLSQRIFFTFMEFRSCLKSFFITETYLLKKVGESNCDHGLYGLHGLYRLHRNFPCTSGLSVVQNQLQSSYNYKKCNLLPLNFERILFDHRNVWESNLKLTYTVLKFEVFQNYRLLSGNFRR